jgi:hypothetical protein
MLDHKYLRILVCICFVKMYTFLFQKSLLQTNYYADSVFLSFLLFFCYTGV